MNSIIPGYIFYLIEVLNNLSIISGIIMVFSFIILVYGGRDYVIEDFYYEDEEKIKIFKKARNVFVIMLIISSTILIIIPSKKTMYIMLANNYITENNIETAGEIVDYIFDKVKKLD